MKNLFKFAALLVVSLVTLSCNDDDTPAQGVEGTWALVEIRSQWTRDVLTGEDMYIRESYNFYHNGTFTKTRPGAEFDFQGSGTYTISDPDRTVEGNENLRFIMDLTFEKNVSSELVYGCNIIPESLQDDDELTERLYLRDDGLLRNWGCILIADLNWLVYSK